MILLLLIIFLNRCCCVSSTIHETITSNITNTIPTTNTSSALIIESTDSNDVVNKILPEFNANAILLYYNYITYHDNNVTLSNMISNVLDYCNNGYINNNTNVIINTFLSYYQLNIIAIFHNINNNNNIDKKLYWNISDQLNKCYYNQTDTYVKNILLYVASVIWPGNHVALKNLGLELLDYGFYTAALKLFDDCVVITDDYGCIIYHVFAVPSHFWSSEQTNMIYYDTMKKVDKALSINVNIILFNPSNSISSTPTHMQYLGISPRILSESYSKVINHMFPVLRQSYLSPNTIVSKRGGMKAIKLGIVSEAEMNSSPGLCFTGIFPRLRIQSIERNDGQEIEIIFFARIDSITVFANVAMKTANKVIFLNLDDFQASYDSILSENLDILLYLGIPTNDKYTSFLSQMRLAPVQIQFAVGHPLTSGSLSIDYSVSSILFHDASSLKATDVDADKCLAMLKTNADFQSSCDTVGPLANTYVEQLVLFDTMTYHIQDPTKFYKGTSNFLNTKTMKVATKKQCQDLDDYLDYIQLTKWNITSDSLGCGNNNSFVRLYMLVQTSRKLHPLMDAAIYKILTLDSSARIIVNSPSKNILMFRSLKQAPIYLNEIQTRVIPIEKRIDHEKYLRLLSLSSVFLNPFPYGSGITSAEAIAFCIPIIIFPKSISYIQLALGQLRMLQLPSDIEKLYIAESINDYAYKAVRLAKQRQQHNEDHYCVNRNRDKLFSAVHLEATVNEWINFLRDIVI